MKLTNEQFSAIKLLVQAGQQLIKESNLCGTLCVFEELAGFSMERADYSDHVIVARILAVQLKANMIDAVQLMQKELEANCN